MPQSSQDLYWVVSLLDDYALSPLVWAVHSRGEIEAGTAPLNTHVPFQVESLSIEGVNRGMTPAGIVDFFSKSTLPLSAEDVELGRVIQEKIRLSSKFGLEDLHLLAMDTLAAYLWSPPLRSAETKASSEKIEEAADRFPAVGYVYHKDDWMRAIAVARNAEHMLHVITLPLHQSTRLMGFNEEEDKDPFVRREHLLISEQYFNTPSVGVAVNEPETCGYEDWAGVPSLWEKEVDPRHYQELFESIDDLRWIIVAAARLDWGILFTMAITTSARHKSGKASFFTETSPGLKIRDQLYETHGRGCLEIDGKYYNPALRKVQEEMHKNPVSLSSDEKELLGKLVVLLEPYGAKRYKASLEIVTALHWQASLVIDEQVPADFSVADAEKTSLRELLQVVQVVHQSPSLAFPFLCSAQLWYGGVLSVAVGRDQEKGLLQVVTLENYGDSWQTRNRWSIEKYQLLDIPERFFSFEENACFKLSER